MGDKRLSKVTTCVWKRSPPTSRTKSSMDGHEPGHLVAEEMTNGDQRDTRSGWHVAERGAWSPGPRRPESGVGQQAQGGCGTPRSRNVATALPAAWGEAAETTAGDPSVWKGRLRQVYLPPTSRPQPGKPERGTAVSAKCPKITASASPVTGSSARRGRRRAQERPRG